MLEEVLQWPEIVVWLYFIHVLLPTVTYTQTRLHDTYCYFVLTPSLNKTSPEHWNLRLNWSQWAQTWPPHPCTPRWLLTNRPIKHFQCASTWSIANTCRERCWRYRTFQSHWVDFTTGHELGLNGFATIFKVKTVCCVSELNMHAK